MNAYQAERDRIDMGGLEDQWPVYRKIVKPDESEMDPMELALHRWTQENPEHVDCLTAMTVLNLYRHGRDRLVELVDRLDCEHLAKDAEEEQWTWDAGRAEAMEEKR